VVIGCFVIEAVEGVDSQLLDPRASWADAAAYDLQAEKLVALFVANFRKFGEDAMIDASAGPRLAVAAE